MLRLLYVLAIMYAVTACGDGANTAHNHDHDHDHTGHSHDHDHDHAGHDHDGHDHSHGTAEATGNAFGTAVDPQGAITADLAIAKIESGEGTVDVEVGEGETVQAVPVKLEGTVSEVCQAAGCWLKVQSSDGTELFVDTKHEFLFPKDITGKTIVLDGNAYKTVQSVEEQRHFKEDAGASPEVIAAITEPKTTYTVLVKGAVLK